MKHKIIIISLLILVGNIQAISFAEELEIFTNNVVYSYGESVFVFGKALPNENLIVRLFAPDETIAKFEQVITDSKGAFNLLLITWPESTTNLPHGTYTVEVISTVQQGTTKSIDVKFTSSSELIKVPIERSVNTLVFAPETTAINTSFRIFVQLTSDGLLVVGHPENLLGTSHVHLPSGDVQNLSTSFQTLHQGLYYVDYTPTQKGTYVFHMVGFSQGTISHGSAATQVLSSDIGGISEQIIELNSVLDETSQELEILKNSVEGFGSTLERSSEIIDGSVTSISGSVKNIEEASFQLNSLLFPVVASIAIIVALQIVIIARRR